MSRGAPVPADHAAAAAEQVARAAYGRLVATLAARWRDLDAAEDALADAFEAALSSWPRTGAPDRPDAWLLTAASRRLIDARRRAVTASAAAEDVRRLAEEAAMETRADAFPDRRLALLFACAHPAISPALHTPLMLQAVLGLTAERIAAAFLASPAAMGQRLARGKAKIREAGIAFEIPGAEALPARTSAVLEAIYGAYTVSFAGDDAPLADEALFLARTAGELLARDAPEASPEAGALTALILYGESRRGARRDAEGRYVPLAQQDSSLWDASLIEEAEARLRASLSASPPGRFALEASIQSVHAARRVSGEIDWRALVALYDALASTTGGIGVEIARAAAHGEAFSAEQGLALLSDLERKASGRLAAHQPFHAVRAHLLAKAGRETAASAAYADAIRLAEDPAVAAFLRDKAAALAR